MAAAGDTTVKELFLRHIRAANEYGAESLWEFASKELDEAEALCKDPRLDSEERRYCWGRLLIQRSSSERRQANYSQVVRILEPAIADYGAADLTQAEMLGELGVAYLRQDMPEKADGLFKQQHALSTRLAEDSRAAGSEKVESAWRAEGLICRAVGYRGIIAYQLAVPDFEDAETFDNDLLGEAIRFNTERVERAKVLLHEIANEDAALKKEIMANTRHCVALDRLTLCYGILGDNAKALECARESVEAGKAFDPTIQALGRFYYGLALHRNGNDEDAMKQWQAFGEGNRCTAAIAVCKEPSGENIKYLKQLAKHRVPMGTYDEQGYSALDYAVMGRNSEMEAVVVESLRQELLASGMTADAVEQRIELRRIEAHRRREYRSIFQKSFRPFLRANALQGPQIVAESQQASDNAETCIRHLRHQYLGLLASSESARSTFDSFKFIPLSDFREKLGKLPRPGNEEDMRLVSRLIRTHNLQDVRGQGQDPYIVFLSYRWLGKASPDDVGNTQYHRMNRAMDLFLEKHPWLKPDRVGIWLDVGCIDQVDFEGRQRGINALAIKHRTV